MGRKKEAVQREPKPRTPLKRTAFKCKGGRLRKVGKTKRGREQRVLDSVVRPLVIQETAEALGIHREDMEHLDLDHLLGRHGVLNGIPVMLNPRVLQLLTRAQHQEKTRGLIISSKFDFRTKPVQERLFAAAEKLEERYKEIPFDLKDFRKAVRGMLWGSEQG